MSKYYIGIMSGTSLDAIDAVITESKQNNFSLKDTLSVAWDKDLQSRLLDFQQHDHTSLKELAQLDILTAKAFANAALQILQKTNISPEQVTAIGCHGQTIGHWPNATPPATSQIGDPNTIAAMTGITTIADFRRRDLAHGGQGAPLVPAFHHALFAKEKMNRIVLNIGGIANISLLKGLDQSKVIGFDTGPGNGLMDAWTKKHHNESYDNNGEWANSGQVDNALLQQCLADPYFALSSPKSTGREYFNLNWLEQNLKNITHSIDATNIQATQLALTVESIANAIESLNLKTLSDILVCGGGVHNHALMQKLTTRLANYAVNSTATAGVEPDWIEATAFAWLAQQRLQQQPGNLPAVTGASKPCVLGGVFWGD